MLSIRLDLIDSRRFVCLDVDPSYRKSIWATLKTKTASWLNSEGSKMLSIRLDSIDSRRFVCLDVDPSYQKSICATLKIKTASWLTGQGRKCSRFDSIRSIRDDSSALMSTRHTGSRFARHLQKNCKLVNRAGSKMLSIRLDSIDSRRFVSLDVDPSYQKSICATLKTKTASWLTGQGRNVVDSTRFDRFETIRQP